LNFFPFQSVSYLLAILFYLSGLWIFHFTAKFSSLKTEPQKAIKEILILTPFILPFLIFSLTIDFILFYPDSHLVRFFKEATPLISELAIWTGTLLFISFMMIVFPYVIQWIWQCKPLEIDDPELKAKLEKICQTAQFKHAGIKTWGLMNDSLTAAIIGIIPKIRYVIFTKKLIKKLSFNAISAILAHEIGHWYRKHLLIYPLIMVGLVVLLNSFETHFQETLPPLLFFTIYILCLILYFRLVFGFFSRIFERQADLHVYKLKIDPKYMVEALDHLAKASGNSHLVPCWHHYSIQERIDFINQTIDNPDLIEKHHLFAKKALCFYFISLVLFFTLDIVGT
jgi:STE24 endopeptidase